MKKTKPSKQKVTKVLALLKEHYPDAHCALHFQSPFQLLVATVLSAQCTDARVNMVTPNLFAKYPDAETMAQANQKDVEQVIRSTGFFRSKAKSLISASTDLVQKHKGQLPQTMDEMVKLRGVGRKTANVVLGVAFNKAFGVVVDTHVLRLSQRLGFSNAKDAVRMERDLMQIIPKEDWILLPHLLISHGRQICKARNPNCGSCFLNRFCLYYAGVAGKTKKS